MPHSRPAGIQGQVGWALSMSIDCRHLELIITLCRQIYSPCTALYNSLIELPLVEAISTQRSFPSTPL